MPLLLSIDVDQGVAAQPAHSGVVIPRRCAVATSIPFRYSAPVRWIHWLTVLLVLGHIGAALYHRVVKRDDIMQRML